ncbi:hypothetical protein [Vibrio proteolyticus]|nr:hypothetical protein [Vibrio proteolyticus]
MKTTILVLLLLLAPPVFADCPYNGKSYAEGSVIGPYTCKNGKWEK